MEERLITAVEVQQRFVEIPLSTVYALAQRGIIPSYKIGSRHVRFKASEIARWIETQKRPAAIAK